MDSKFAAAYEDLERGHFWHLVRRRILTEVLQRYVKRPGGEVPRLLDVGCGSGINLAYWRDEFDCLGVEPDALLVDRAEKNSKVSVVQCAMPCKLPYEPDSFDVVVLADVLEHVQDDRGTLMCLKEYAKSDGVLVINVPAHPWLWSDLDEVNHHQRRYQQRDLERLLRETGWEVEESRHWGSLGLPLVYGQRRWVWGWRRRSYNPSVPERWVNRAIEVLMYKEYQLTKKLRLPFGVSLLAVVRNRK